jgi:uncharacterized membrane protein YcaP (DUF421 family)
VWHHVWHLDLTVAEKAIRPILIYVFLIVVLRLIGKRELGQTNTLDLVVLLLVANAVQNGIIGNDLSVTGAFIGAGVLFALNETLNRITYQFPWAEKLIDGEPTILIKDGMPVEKAMRRSGISLTELLASARRQGFADLSEVQTAILETNGVVSMFRKGESPRDLHPAEPGGIKLGKRRRVRR